MNQVSTLPVVFLASVNSTDEDNRPLKYLVREEKFIAKTLTDKGDKAYCQVIRKSDLASGEFLSMIRNPEQRNKVAILHLSGHVNGSTLTFDCGPNQGEIEISKLSTLIARLPNLKVVYLSGCATNELVEMLLLRDIPAVIATETKDDGVFSASIARSFYQSMAAGLSIRDTYEQLRLMFGGLMPKREVGYNLEANRLEWDGKLADEAQESFPWGMYILADNDSKLDWKLRKYLNLKDYSRGHKTSLRNRIGKSLNWMVPALVATAVISGIFFFLGDYFAIDEAWSAAISINQK